MLRILVVSDIGIHGRILEIVNFTRECECPYMCIAESNFTKSVNSTIVPIPKCKFKKCVKIK